MLPASNGSRQGKPKGEPTCLGPAISPGPSAPGPVLRARAPQLRPGWRPGLQHARVDCRTLENPLANATS